jgi:hypothetical protein
MIDSLIFTLELLNNTPFEWNYLTYFSTVADLFSVGGEEYLRQQLKEKKINNSIYLLAVVHCLKHKEDIDISIDYIKSISIPYLYHQNNTVVAEVIDSLTGLRAFNVPEVLSLLDREDVSIQAALLNYKVLSSSSTLEINTLLTKALESEEFFIRVTALHLIEDLNIASSFDIERFLNDSDDVVQLIAECILKKQVQQRNNYDP